MKLMWQGRSCVSETPSIDFSLHQNRRFVERAFSGAGAHSWLPKQIQGANGTEVGCPNGLGSL